MSKRKSSIIFISIFIILIGIYYLLRQQERQQIELAFDKIKSAYNKKDSTAFLNCMTPKYKSNHSGEEAKNFWIDNNNLFALEKGWALSLSFSFKEAWVYPFSSSIFEPWNGPEYQLKKINGEWLFTGGCHNYLD